MKKPSKAATPKQTRVKGLFLCSMSDLMQLFGVSHETISDYTRNGMPRSDGSGYNVKVCVDWWLDNIYKGKAEERDDSMTEHKRRYWKEKADQIEFQNEAQRGEHLRRAEVEAGIADLVINLRASMLSWPSRVFPNDDVLRAVLRSEVHGFLSTIYENKLIVPKHIAVVERPKKKKTKRPTNKKLAKGAAEK